MTKKIKVVTKHPGCKARTVYIENNLNNFQKFVGGYIEVVRFAEDAAIIVNEEGKLNGMKFNFGFYGDSIFGPVIFVGIDGEEFCDLPFDDSVVNIVF